MSHFYFEHRKTRLYLLHFTLPKEDLPTSEFSDRDPDELIQKYFGHGVALHIGIYNSAYRSPYSGEYDILISNPEAR